MQTITEPQRHASPGGRPQPLAFHAGTLWAGSWDTSHLYAIDPATWKVVDEVAAPGKPYGLAAFGDALRVVVSHDDDDRYLYRFVPGRGFDVESKTPCPELTGSHLTTDGTTLYLLQMGNRRIVTLDENGAVRREIPLPTHCGGIGWSPAAFYMISADSEFDVLQLATLDVDQEQPAMTAVAAMPPEARALAFDGSSWWTSLREASEIASFTLGAAAASR